MKQIEVTIMGQSYILGCPEGGEQSLLEAVGNVDREMSAIRDAGKVKARERIAVLAALNLAFALAERPAAPIALEPTPTPTPTPMSTPISPAAPSAGHVADPSGIDADSVDALIRRIDQSLAEDGQLL